MAQLLIKRVYFPRTDFPQDGWIGANVPAPEVYDPALYPPIVQLANSFMAAKRKDEFLRKVEQPRMDWLTAQLGLWEVPYFAAIDSQSKTGQGAHGTKEKQHQFFIEQPQTGWLNTAASPGGGFNINQFRDTRRR
jgi:hypothetical protein